jgi:phosphopantetheinyl transferase (holo-ACP synthase)
MPNPDTYLDQLILNRPDEVFTANCCYCYYPLWEHYQGIIAYLHPEEQKYYNSLKFEKRMRSFLIGRYAAKRAVAALTGETDLAKIMVQAGVFTQPIVTLPGHPNIQVSISHCDHIGGALAYPEAHPLGIDIEKIHYDKNGVLEKQMTMAELELIKTQPDFYEAMLARMWTAKEALSKVIKTGLMTPMKVYEINKIEHHENYFLSYYKNFGQYKTITFKISNYICAITHPMKTRLDMDIAALQSNFKVADLIE